MLLTAMSILFFCNGFILKMSFRWISLNLDSNSWTSLGIEYLGSSCIRIEVEIFL